MPGGRTLDVLWPGYTFASDRLQREVQAIVMPDADACRQYGVMGCTERRVVGGQGCVDFSVARSGRHVGEVRANLTRGGDKHTPISTATNVDAVRCASFT